MIHRCHVITCHGGQCSFSGHVKCRHHITGRRVLHIHTTWDKHGLFAKLLVQLVQLRSSIDGSSMIIVTCSYSSLTCSRCVWLICKRRVYTSYWALWKWCRGCVQWFFTSHVRLHTSLLWLEMSWFTITFDMTHELWHSVQHRFMKLHVLWYFFEQTV